jgi:D-alanyl-D-alanine carboxypeptidase (penicillin-binding protein 5/6)
MAALVFAAAVVVAVPSFGVLAVVRASAAPPRAVARMFGERPAPLAVTSTVPAVPWPPSGQAAVSVPEVGYTAQSGPEHPVPVASMTKVMTAYLILHDHPLSPGEAGPDITITATDAADYGTDTVSDQSSVLITQGEVLTESQMLQGMLVHSANDLAYSLACWDAGSVPAFVAKMNATATSLGMTQTHYADASGFTPRSVSTPADLLKVTSLAMENPVFAADVSMPSVTLPVSGTSYSYTPLLAGSTGGVAGVVGVKSGYTTTAGGGDILAFRSSVGGRTFTVLAAVSSQQGPDVLATAGNADLAIARSVAGAVRQVAVDRTGEPVGTESADGKTVPVVTASQTTLLAAPGAMVDRSVEVTRHLVAGAPRGSLVGAAYFAVGDQRVAVPIRTAGTLPAPDLVQRVF